MDVIITFAIYFAFVNICSFAVMGIDKLKAKVGAFRIPEASIFLLAIIGGAPGAIVGMHLFRHKTKHWYFLYGLPAILIIQIVLVLFLGNSFFSFKIL